MMGMGFGVRNYLVALAASVTGMIVVGFIRPYIVFKTLGEQGLLVVASLTTGFMLARAFSSLYTGIWVKNKGFRYTGVSGLVLWALSLYLYTLIPSSLYPLNRILEGFSAGLLWPTMQMLVVESLPSSWRAKGLSIYFVIGSIAYNFSIWLGGLLKPVIGAMGLFTLSFLLLAGYIVFYILALIEPRSRSSGQAIVKLGDYSRLLGKIKDLIPLILVVGGISGLSLDYLLAYAKNISGFSSELARTYWSYAGYLGLALSLLLSHLADKYGGDRINYGVAYMVSLAIMLISMPLPPIILYTLVSLPLLGSKIFKPIIRSSIVGRTGEKELGVTITNTISNLGAAFMPLLVALTNTIVPTHINLGLMVYGALSLAIILYITMRTKK